MDAPARTGPAPSAVAPSAARSFGGPARQHGGLGIVLRIAAMACMATMFAMVKWCGLRGVPVLEMLFFRNAVAMVPLMAFILPTTGVRVLRTSRPLGHLMRASVGLVGLIGGFLAVTHLPLTQWTALSFSSPLFMTGLSALILKEHVGVHRWAAVVIGFLGVLVMARPEVSHAALLGTVFALVSAAGGAGANIAIREIGKTEPGPTIVFYFMLAGSVVGVASLPLGWVMPDRLTLAILIAAGFLGGVGQLLLTQALRVAPVAVVAPFDYTQIIWAGLIGFFVWGETLHPRTIAGAAIVAGSGVYILYRELQSVRLRAAAAGIEP